MNARPIYPESLRVFTLSSGSPIKFALYILESVFLRYFDIWSIFLLYILEGEASEELQFGEFPESFQYFDYWSLPT